ncbi:uncharacterized protein LOC120417713 isoform X2 [Culex pipiens pallens]|uniref:uncharacterized protein LOC120417713 isoform X2 n=1 Tax=Culex pipiens pallens TaxID=42434 RepID=UPI001953EE29|nr:uncharacterized protein LOC120417713 isoform X2 [Culex pipiens pallens]
MQELVKINDKHYIVDIRRKVPSDSDDRKPEVAPAESTTIQCCLFDLAQLWCETISVRNLIEREKIKHRDPPEMPGSPTKLNKTSLTLTPTKRSPGGRAKGLEAIYAKQKMPKAATGSSISLKRLQADLSDEEDDKDAIEKMSNAGLDSSGVSDTGLKGKIRKITKL